MGVMLKEIDLFRSLLLLHHVEIVLISLLHKSTIASTMRLPQTRNLCIHPFVHQKLLENGHPTLRDPFNGYINQFWRYGLH